jgi:hypothetical protein
MQSVGGSGERYHLPADSPIAQLYSYIDSLSFPLSLLTDGTWSYLERETKPH